MAQVKQAKKAAATPASLQAPFDPRIITIAQPMQSDQSPISRGYMIQKDSLPGYSTKFIFNYQYNPSTVQAEYDVQAGGAALSYLFPNPLDRADLAAPVNAGASWTVMYDRTYELNSGSYAPGGVLLAGSTATPTPGNITADPKVYGVLADILQLQAFTGQFLTGSQAVNAKGVLGAGKNGKTHFSATTGFMMMVPCWAYFGGKSDLYYYGFISEFDVTVTHWTKYMVPMRCVIDISFSILPPPAPDSGSSGNRYYNPGGGGSGGGKR